MPPEERERRRQAIGNRKETQQLVQMVTALQTSVRSMNERAEKNKSEAAIRAHVYAQQLDDHDATFREELQAVPVVVVGGGVGVGV